MIVAVPVLARWLWTGNHQDAIALSKKRKARQGSYRNAGEEATKNPERVHVGYVAVERVLFLTVRR